MRAIVTAPPYAPYLEEILEHPIVDGLRLNTVMPVVGPYEEVLHNLDTKAKKYGKKLWVDLKGRQLRIATHGVPPFTSIELTHKIRVNTPTKAYFHGGKEYATVLRVDDNRLIMQEGPKSVVGPGESVNIPDPSLCIDGYLTETDTKYLTAAKAVGVNRFMLSFVESKGDLMAAKELYPEAHLIAKIESHKGMEYVRSSWNGEVRLMAARGDLFVEMPLPHLASNAVEDIVRKNPNAIAASRIFDSMETSYLPSSSDIGDVENLMRMGYKTVMFGDEICFKRDSIISGLNLLGEMSKEYMRRHK